MIIIFAVFGIFCFITMIICLLVLLYFYVKENYNNKPQIFNNKLNNKKYIKPKENYNIPGTIILPECICAELYNQPPDE